MRVRYRVDGELQPVMTIPNHIEEAVVARIKVMADMDTTENRRPQDGHLSVQEAGTKVNFRVSTIPTVGGEKVVMRLLDEGSKTFELQHLGMCERDLKAIQTLIDRPHGMIVVTGPTGSGKSTTMYALLSKLNSVSRNIVTVEDPVEYRLPGINQVASDNEHGLGFANALKYIMRQDPDVIMVGEIRDHETAATAVQAALTGHLLISTLHANDAIGAVARLDDLGVDNFKIGGALLGSIAQRLVAADLHRVQGSRSSRTNRCSRRCARIASCPPTRCSTAAAAARNASAPATRAVFRFTKSWSSRRRWPKAIENGVPHTKLRQIATVRRHGRTCRRRHGASARRPHDAGRSVLQTVELDDRRSMTDKLTRQSCDAHENIAGERFGRRGRQRGRASRARAPAATGWWLKVRRPQRRTGRRSSKTATWCSSCETCRRSRESGVSLPKALGTLAEEKAAGKAPRHAAGDSPPPRKRRIV